MNVKKHLGYCIVIVILGLCIFAIKRNDAQFVGRASDSLRKLQQTNQELADRNSELINHLGQLTGLNTRLRAENERLASSLQRIQEYSSGAADGIERAIQINQQLREILTLSQDIE